MKLLHALLLVFFVSLNAFAVDLVIDDAMIKKAEEKYGMFAKNRFIAWRDELIIGLKDDSEMRKINVVNTWFNEIRYMSDQKNYNQSDYWATPYEFVGRDAGDCEDYVIAKYYTLKALGVDINRMKFTYVVYRDRRGKEISHMVLSYFKVPNPKSQEDILILDNNNRLVLPASKRPDIVKVVGMINGDTGAKSQKWTQLELDMKRKKL